MSGLNTYTWGVVMDQQLHRTQQHTQNCLPHAAASFLVQVVPAFLGTVKRLSDWLNYVGATVSQKFNRDLLCAPCPPLGATSSLRAPLWLDPSSAAVALV